MEAEALEACECPVCFIDFNDGLHIPLATTCGHTICQKCISQLEKESSEYNCPLCRNSLQAGSCKVNVALRQLIMELWKLRHTREGVPLARSPSVLDIPFSDIQMDDVIDSGAFGEVYKARWRGNKVAVKQLRGATVTDKSRASFQREIFVMNCLRHPNIVLLLGACQTPPHLCIVMELLLGGSLYHMIYDNGYKMTLKQIQQVSLDITCGLQYLHGINILHRDLKSKNVLLTNNQFPCQAKLCDFGLARMRQETATMTGNIGTVHWTAPEVMNSKRYRFTADVYSLGMVLYEMASGKLPFADKIPMAVMVSVVINKERPPMDEVKSYHGDDSLIQKLIEKCSEWEESQRPNIAEVLSMLTELVPMETSGKRAQLVSQQSCDLQSMTIDGLKVVFVAESSSDLTDTTSSTIETNMPRTALHDDDLLGAVGGSSNVPIANDPDLELMQQLQGDDDGDLELARQLQQEEEDRYRKQLEQDEALARHLQHQDFSYRVPANSAALKRFPDNQLMQSVRKFDQTQLRHGVPPPPPLPPSLGHTQQQQGIPHGVPDAPPPPPLPPSIMPPPFVKHNVVQQRTKFSIGDQEERYSHQPESLPLSNVLLPSSSYQKSSSYSNPSTTGKHKQLIKTSNSLPYGASDFERKGIPEAPPPPHLPIRRQPSALLREIRGETSYTKRKSGHNLGPYGILNHVEPVEKRAFRVGRVLGGPIHVVTLQEVIKSFNKGHLNQIQTVEPQPMFPVGRVVQNPPVHVPKMKAVFSKKKDMPFVTANKREPNRLKKSKAAAAAAPEDKLPRIPTPPNESQYPLTKNVKFTKKK